MYGLPSPSSGDICTRPITVGAFVVYEGRLHSEWGRYRVVGITEHSSGSRYNLSSYHDDTVVLSGVSRGSIAAIPAGVPHQVLNPAGRINAVLQQRAQASSDSEHTHVDPELSSTVLSLLACNRFVEAEVHLLRAELALGILAAQTFRERIEQLLIRGDDASYLPYPVRRASASSTYPAD